ncbi:hypothetical protein L9F63_006416, partial [Diploptera punctata]
VSSNVRILCSYESLRDGEKPPIINGLLIADLLYLIVLLQQLSTASYLLHYHFISVSVQAFGSSFKCWCCLVNESICFMWLVVK